MFSTIYPLNLGTLSPFSATFSLSLRILSDFTASLSLSLSLSLSPLSFVLFRFCISFIKLNMRFYLPLRPAGGVRNANKDYDENKWLLIIRDKARVTMAIAL